MVNMLIMSMYSKVEFLQTGPLRRRTELAKQDVMMAWSL